MTQLVQRIGGEFLVNTATVNNQFGPTVTALPGGFVVSWVDDSGTLGDTDGYGIKAQLFDARGGKVGGEFLVNTATAGAQLQPTVTGLSGGGFVVSWADRSGTLGDASGYGVTAQVFDARGGKVGGEFLVNTATAGNQWLPTVTGLSGGGFVASWEDHSETLGDTDDASVKAQLFDARGGRVGGEFLVNTATTGNQGAPTITALSGGGFVVSWRDSSGTSSAGIKAQLFDAGGGRVGGEFLVNTATAYKQDSPTITALSGGGFVVSWQDSDLDDYGVRVGIKAQLFDARGGRVGGEFLVNTATTIAYDLQGPINTEQEPAVTALSGGGFVVSWVDSGTPGDADRYDIKAQVFDASGGKVGGEFLVNAVTANNQFGPTVTGLPGDGFVVSWEDNSGTPGDTNGYSVRAQVFGLVTTNTGPTITGVARGTSLTDVQTATPFSGAVLADPDAGQAETVTLTLAGDGGTRTDANGTLSLQGQPGFALAKTGAGTYQLTGTSGSGIAALQAALRAVVFTPTANQLAVGATVGTFVGVGISDGQQSASTVSYYTATSVNDAPAVTGLATRTSLTDKQTATPFAGAVLADPDAGQAEAVTLTLGRGGIATDAAGSLSLQGQPGFALTKAGAGTYRLSGTSGSGIAALQAALRAVVFTPAQDEVAPGATAATSAGVSISDGQQAADAATVLAVLSANDAAAITGTAAGAVAEDGILAASGTLSVSDPDVGQARFQAPLTAALVGAYGDFSFDAATGKWGYALANGRAAVQALAQGQAVTDTLTVTSVDGTASQAITVTVTGANDAPTIAGAKAGQVTADNAAVKPFATVAVADVDAGAQDGLTITVQNAQGAATDANGVLSGTGLAKTGVGTYQLAPASPAALTAALDALVFTPTRGQVAAGGTVTTRFQLAASDGIATTTDGTTTVTATAQSYIDGPAGGFGLLVGTPGADMITAYGRFNAIFGKGGADVINGGDGNAAVMLGDGNASVALGGAGNVVLGGNGNVTVTGAPRGYSAVTLGNGNNAVTLGGLYDVVVLGTGTNAVTTGGMAFVKTGGGDDTITLGGSGSTVDAGAGRNVIRGGTGKDTFVLPGAGGGFDTIAGFTETNGDVLDLRAALAATTWNHKAATLANYLKVTNGGSDTNLAIAPTGSGARTGIATLTGVKYGLADLLSHNSLLT